MKNPRFLVFPSSPDYRWALYAYDGLEDPDPDTEEEVLLTSGDGFASVEAAIERIKLVRTNCLIDSNYSHTEREPDNSALPLVNFQLSDETGNFLAWGNCDEIDQLIDVISKIKRDAPTARLDIEK